MAYPMEKTQIQTAKELIRVEKKLIKARMVALENIQIANTDLELVDQYLVDVREKMKKAGSV